MAKPSSDEAANRIWKKKKNRILIIVAIFGLFCIILVPIIVSYSANDVDYQTTADEKVHVQQKTCSSQTCLKEALQILEHINPDVDPCDDFYGFVCGNMWKRLGSRWSFEVELEEEISKQVVELYDEPDKDEDHIMVKKVKKLYRTCIEYGQYDHMGLRSALAIAGRWPMISGENWDETIFEWLEETFKFRELGFSHSIFFGVSITVHPENKSEYVFEVTLPTIDLLDEEIMMEIAQKIGVDQNIALTEIDLVHRWKEFFSIDFEEGNDHNIFTVSEYQKMQDVRSVKFNWLRFINTILSPATQITKNSYVIFPQAQKVSHRFTILARTSKRAQANYMMWKVIEGLAPDLVLDLKRKHESGIYTTRENQCVDFVQKRFVPNPIYVIYVKRYLPIEKINLLNEMVANIKVEVLELLKKAEWLDVKDKTNAIKTFNEMTIIMGAPKTYFSTDTILDDLLVDMENTLSDSYVELILQMEKNYQTFRYKQIHKPVVQWKPQLTHFQWNYNEDKNVIEIPAGFLQGVMFNENRPTSLNYGHFGTTIGTWQFGALFMKETDNENGSYNNTWSNNTFRGLREKRNCFFKQASLDSLGRYDRDSLNFYLSQKIMATKASYIAYKKWKNNNGDDTQLGSVNYTSNQLYWISSLSNWCDSRVFAKIFSEELKYNSFEFYTIVHNLNFAMDFNCPVGSRMNSINNCSIF